MVFPVAAERVVAVFRSKWLVVRQCRNDGNEITVQRSAIRAVGGAIGL